MTKLDVLYDWPINEIERLTTSADAEGFSNLLTEPDITDFVNLTEQINGFGSELVESKGSNCHFPNWAGLRNSLVEFETHFPSFPDSSFKKFRLFSILAEVLAQTGDPLDPSIINGARFEIRQLPDILPVSWFNKENGKSFDDSVAVFRCSDFTALESEIVDFILSPSFILHMLATLTPFPELTDRQYVLVKRTTPQIDMAAVDAFARLVILSSGRPVHSPHNYAPQPPISVIDSNIFLAGTEYQQWNEILNVLSEYNSRKEILLKFLTIYHVIENLMIKFPIVQLERLKGGQMFSLRDFRTMYERVDASEAQAINLLFTAVLEEVAIPATPPTPATAATPATPGSPAKTFAAHFVDRWQSLSPASVPGLEAALGSLDVVRGKRKRPVRHPDFATASECAAIFAQMVYKTRCAIVHNKETEFHLTYATLDAGFKTLLEQFLLPCLEEICFSLIGQQNPQVWYSGKHLLLYQ